MSLRTLFLGCLEHANDICPDCAFDKRCGNKTQSDDCNLIKMTEMNNLVQNETAKIKGTASFGSFYDNEIYFMKLAIFWPDFSIEPE